MLKDKRILLIIGGGIAAYKSLELIRLLRKAEASVHAILTSAGQHFVTPLSVSALCEARVFTDLFDLTAEAEMGHIELSRAADLVVVAPATADLMAKLAGGLANDLASTTLLATDKAVLMAPAMNVRMWTHAATQRNLVQLIADGVLFVGPDEGPMACGEYGPGRMAEPADILQAITAALADEAVRPALVATSTTVPVPKPSPLRAESLPALTSDALQGVRVVITSGPTHEPIDPVRYIANRSSGKQGYAIARAAAAAGAEVTLISGPVQLAPPAGVEVVQVESARDMLNAVELALPAQVFIAAAAVADWRTAATAGQKIKKVPGARGPTLALVENPDILASIAKRRKDRPRLVIGFAAETEEVVAHAKTKRVRKGCDWIVANDVTPASGVMGGDLNTVHIIDTGGVESWPKLAKEEVARRLISRIGDYFAAH